MIFRTMRSRFIRADDEILEGLTAVAAPFGQGLAHQRQGRDEHQRATAVQTLGNPEGGHRLARATGHNQLTAVVLLKSLNHLGDGCLLMEPRLFYGKGWRLFANTSRPAQFCCEQLATEDNSNRLLLCLEGVPGVSTNVIG